MRQLVVIVTLALLSAGFLPYDHDGYAVLPFTDGVVQGRAVFSSFVANKDGHVVVRMASQLPWGGEGFLAVEIRLGSPGDVVPSSWTYYEKLTANLVAFEAREVDGEVIVADRFETLDETSLRLVLSATFVDGDQTRTLSSGTVVTAPAPEILRSHGQLPPGMVVVDDGSGTFIVGPSYYYDRGALHCTGLADEVVIYEDDEEVYYDAEIYDDEIVYEDEIIVYDDDENSQTDYGGDDNETSCNGATDDDYYSEESTSSTYNDDFADCDGSTNDSSSTSSSESDNVDMDCVGDAEAAPRIGRQTVAPQRVGGSYRLARRIVRLSPMLFLVLFLLVIRERSS
jgi:hypothetical protein